VTNSLSLTAFDLVALPTASVLDDVVAPEVTGWLPAVVPGGVHESLIAAEAIPHPFADDNERRDAWIERRDWWYRARFDGPTDLAVDERLTLAFAGLDTVADIWLNRRHVARSRNAFREVVVDVTGVVTAENELLVRFRPPLDGLEVPPVALEQQARLRAVMGAALPEAEAGERATRAKATQVRKAPLSWGWDIAPNVPSIGIQRPVELRRERAAVFSGHHVRTRLVDGGAAEVTVAVEAEAFATESDLEAAIVLLSPRGDRHEARVVLPAGGVRRSGEVALILPEPELWWTHDLGSPALHDLEIRLVQPGARPGLLQTVTDRIGLRTIELDRAVDPDEPGRFFRLRLNGVPVFARGAAWVPASMLLGAVPDEVYRDRIRLARNGNLTMLRVWGGGAYENDAFYAACDENGIMLWHDFMFACNDYPSDDAALAAEVAAEAEYQVRRLRNRASMALWAGSNEVQVIHSMLYQSVEGAGWGREFFDGILPDAVARFDGAVPYWPGSPFGEVVGDESVFEAISGMIDGDQHSWSVWHGATMAPVGPGTPFPTAGDAMHYRRYREEKGRFVTEFGIHSAPNLSTLEAWIARDDLALHSDAFDGHNKDHPKDKGDALLEVTTGLPTTLEEHIDFSQAVQAEGLGFGIEHLRRRQPHTSGALVWAFNDVWPGSSWSLVDYDGAPKAAYYSVKRASAPVALSFVETAEGGLELWAVNSSRDDREARMHVSLARFDGEGTASVDVDAALEPLSVRRVWHGDVPEAVGSPHHFAWASSDDPRIPTARHFFVELKDVAFGPSSVRTTVEVVGAGRAVVEIESTGYTYQAHVPAPNGLLRFDDNHLDLRDGERVSIEVTGLPDGFDPERLVARGSLVGRR
jgi:beta-mannosidase